MFSAKKKLPFFVEKAELQKVSFGQPKTGEGSDSGDSFLDEEEIRRVRSKNSSQKRWWTGFVIVHLLILAIYAGTVLRLQNEMAHLRKHGLQLVQCK